MNVGELIAFILYFLVLLAIGQYFYKKDAKIGSSEKDYFLGGRGMGPWVTGLSAQASDMSGWLLMGLPGSILLAGFGQLWIAIGLAIGSYLTWLLIAGRLRKMSQAANDSITVPQYLKNRFMQSSLTLQIVCAVIFFVCFTVYVASGYKAGGDLFSSVLGIDPLIAKIIFGVIVMLYTFTGGYKAVCWTDFFQALLMLVAMLAVPIIVIAVKDVSFADVAANDPNYFNFLPTGKADWTSISTIITGLGWGLGYTGMPHILVRYMSIKEPKMIKQSRRIATGWVVITLAMACLIGIVGRIVLPELLEGNQETVFIKMVDSTLPGFLAGIVLSAILAASMSTADSQLLVASSAFTSDIYKPVFKKDASDKEMLWVGRLFVVIIAVAAFVISIIPGSGSIMDLVGNAWAGFGSAFGPVIVLSVYWKRLTYKGALAGIIVGGLVDIIWLLWLTAPTGIYEIVPGFIMGLLACIIVSLIDKKPSAEVEAMFENAIKSE